MGQGHTHHHAGQCAGLDHNSAEYTPAQRADLERVLAFNRDMAAAIDQCRDVAQVEAFLDPDPLRYMWVDEGQGQIGRVITEATAMLTDAARLPDHDRVEAQIVEGTRQATRPSMAVYGDKQLVAYVKWIPGRGDVLRVRLSGTDDALGPWADPDQATDIHRPTAIFDGSGTPWVLWSGTSVIAPKEGNNLGVWASRHHQGSWSTPELISTTPSPSFNQEAVALSDGGLEVVWQGATDQRFAIFSRRFHPRHGWQETQLVSPGDDANVWDPVLAVSPDDSTGYAWSRYESGSYQIVVRRREADGTITDPFPITGGTDYALHPSLAFTHDGRLWCAYDLLTVSGHGGSGPTRLRSATELGSDPDYREGMRAAGDSVPPELLPEVTAELRVVAIDDDGLRQPPGELAPTLNVVPGGLPRLVATEAGLSVAYRVHRKLPLMTYYWEIAVQHLSDAGWLPPTTIRGTDATLEEAGVAAIPGGVLVAAQTDGRLARALEWTEGFGGRECPYLMEHQGAVIWHAIHGAGVVVTSEISTGESARLSPNAFRDQTATPAHPSNKRQEARRWAGQDRERYRTTVASEDLNLYWGDLHRHSLVSRCTAGDEPSLEDFYRYSWDVCEYDFWAVTDHSENSSEFQWWTIQKMADLFHVPQRFVPFYGFEWTSADTGHQNVIFGDVERGAPTFSAFATGTTDPAGLWHALEHHPDFPAITIPHHPGSAMVHNDWDYHHPTYSRLVEVFQACRGNYESDGCFRQYSDATRTGTFMLDGLLRGHRFGLIASSDHGHGASYVGAYAPSLNRADVFQALHSKRTFAATTRDIVLDVRMGDTFMGGEAPAETPRTLTIHASGYTDIARVDIVRGGRMVHAHVATPDLPQRTHRIPIRVEWGGVDHSVTWDGGITLHDATLVQTPFYSPEIVSVATDHVSWEHTTHSFGEPYGAQRGNVEFTIDAGPDARLELNCAGTRAVLNPHELEHGPIPLDIAELGAHGGHLRLEPGVGGLIPLGTRTVDLTWTDPDTLPTFYYVRVYLVDGEMAWSSPIWVG